MKNKKALKSGSYSIVISAIVLAAVIILNLFASELPSSLTRPDMSSAKLTTITDESKAYLDKVSEDVTLYFICETGAEDPYVEGILDRYEDECSYITVEKIDPMTHPAFVKKYTDDKVSNNSIIVESAKRNRVIDYDEIIMYEVSGSEGSYMTQSQYNYYANSYAQYYGMAPQATQCFMAESEITGAVDFVTTEKLPIIYILTGHNELTLGETYLKYVDDENIVTKDLNLIEGDTKKVPEDASAVLIMTPAVDIAKAEAEALIEYIDGGGNVILLTDAGYFGGAKESNLASVCAHMGLEMVESEKTDAAKEGYDSLVLEGDSSCYTGYPIYILPSVTGQGFSEELSSANVNIFMMQSHAIKAIDGAENVETFPILYTSDKAYLYSNEVAPETDAEGNAVESTESANKDEQSFTLAYQSNVTGDDGKGGTLIWFGSGIVFEDDILQYYGYGNLLMFLRAIDTMCEKTTSVALIGKTMSSPALTVSETDSTIWTAVFCVVIPVAVLCAGFAVWFRRRRK